MRLRIATRRSRLALAQAEEVAAELRAAGHQTELVPMSTAGDRGIPPDRSPAGIKGLFVGEIADAVLRGDAELAVHSAKDLPVEDPLGLVIAAVPRRGLPYDVLVSREEALEDGSLVGTSSLRRRAQLLRSRPGVRVEDLRGNVDTRLRKLEEGEIDGLVLAAAGLARLGIEPPNARPLPVDEMVPAPGQGALAVHAREGTRAADAAAAIEHSPSRRTFLAERQLVARLGGGCRLPLGAYAESRTGAVRLLAVVARVNGTDLLRSEIEAPTPEEAASWAADQLLAAGADRILAEVR